MIKSDDFQQFPPRRKTSNVQWLVKGTKAIGEFKRKKISFAISSIQFSESHSQFIDKQMKANKLLKIKHIFKSKVFPSALALMVDLHKGKNKSEV